MQILRAVKRQLCALMSHKIGSSMFRGGVACCVGDFVLCIDLAPNWFGDACLYKAR